MTAFKELHQEWLDHPVTQKFLKHLELEQVNISEGWINGDFSSDTMEGTAQLMFEARGLARGLGFAFQKATEGTFIDEVQE